MAILKDGGDEYEVRIKRYPDGTYFDEYIARGDREKPKARECDRYIIAEAGTTFAIELTLRKGFCFEEYEDVQMGLFLPDVKRAIAYAHVPRPTHYEDSTNRDLTACIHTADVVVDGRRMLDSKLTFRKLDIGEKLDQETNIKGVDPDDLNNFCVTVRKVNYPDESETDEEDSRAIQEIPQWKAKSVDKDSFKKDGTSPAIDFVGGHQGPIPDKPRHSNLNELTPDLDFRFHYRTAEYLEVHNIVKYPPPLTFYSWAELTKDERQTTLKELQKINKQYAINALEVKTGQFQTRFCKRHSKDEPKEWRSWSKMLAWEREAAYENLMNSNNRTQIENNTGTVISLGGGQEEVKLNQQDDSGSLASQNHGREGAKHRDNPKATVEGESNDILASSEPLDSEYISVKFEGGSTVKQETKIKNEPIDHRTSSQPRARPGKQSRRDGRVVSTQDDELERKMARAKALEEEIEMEERLAKLKRERRALQDDIDAERRKKQKPRTAIIELDD